MFGHGIEYCTGIRLISSLFLNETKRDENVNSRFSYIQLHTIRFMYFFFLTQLKNNKNLL